MSAIVRQLILLAAILAAGCSKVTRTYLADEVFVQPVNTDKAYFSADETIDLSKINAADYDGPDNSAKRKILVSDMIALSDKKCTWHKAEVMANANIWNITSGTAAILFAGAASVVTHAQTAAELSAAAAATSGIRSLANQEIYADALVTTILRAIDVQRQKRYAVIAAGLSDGEYTVAEAVRDVQAYHDSCSLMAGLVEVTSALDNRKKSRSEIQRDISDMKTAIAESETLQGLTPEAKKAYVDELTLRLTQAQLELPEASE